MRNSTLPRSSAPAPTVKRVNNREDTMLLTITIARRL